MASLKSMSLIMISLLVLCIPGILYNNLNNNGLVVAQSTGLSCSTDAQTPTCQISGNVGCQASSANCQLAGSSISFFNSKSPFTQLIQGNLFALFTNLNPLSQGSGTNAASQTSWSGSHGPFDNTGNPVYYSADCQGQPNIVTGSKSQTQWSVLKCTQTNTDNSNVTEANVATWNNWNTNWNTTLALQFFQLGNGTFTRSCGEIAQINYTALANGPGWTYFGCTIQHATSIQPVTVNPTHQTWGYLVAMPVSYGNMPAGTTHQHLFVQLTNWFTQQCQQNVNLGAWASNQCANFLAGFKGTSLPCQSTSCPTFVPNSAGAIVFGFLAGVILLVVGLGVQIGFGGGVSAGSNEQGTRLAQALGIGLIIWSFLYSQFSTWFTSGFLPYALDGALGIVSVIVSGMFFVGTVWRALSLD
jgi:hypothetical protein